MATTVQDVINGSLRLIGAIAPGESPTAAESMDALAVLNEMLDSWSTAKLMVYTINRNTFTLTPNQQAYTLGTGGNFNMARPTRIENASILLTNVTPNNEIPIPILSDEDWQNVTIKSTSSTFPTAVYPDGGYPLNTLYFWPVPTTAMSAVLYTWGLLLDVSTLTTSIQFPPGYLKAIRFNLAVALAPEYGREPSQAVIQSALQSRSALESLNWTPMEMVCDDALIPNNGNIMAIKTFGRVVDP